MKIGIVDVGGGMRGIYAAGLFDYCLDHKINFDLCIGVSAGSANLASFLAKQRGRNYKFYTEFAFRKEYMSLENFIQKHNYVDLDYVYDDLSAPDGEYPIDFETLQENPAEFEIVATHAQSGEAVFFNRDDFSLNHYEVFKASSDIPFVCKPYLVKGEEYFDGGVAAPIPYKRAFELGCDYVIVILSRPIDYVRNNRRDSIIARLISKQYPAIAETLIKRAKNYNENVVELKKLQADGKVFVISPDDTCGIDTLAKDKEDLKRLYGKGYFDGEKINQYLKKIKAL